MKACHFALIFFLIAATPCFSQLDSTATLADTTLANQYFRRAKVLAGKAQFDSSTFYYEKANQIYESAPPHDADSLIWQKY